jgi:hypothetical protein
VPWSSRMRAPNPAGPGLPRAPPSQWALIHEDLWIDFSGSEAGSGAGWSEKRLGESAGRRDMG